MSEAALATEILAPQTNTSGAVVAPVARFDDRLATAFVMKSLSAETRETYRRGIQEFFLYAGWLHPTQVTTEYVLRYRDRLMRDNRRPATVAQKLSIIRSFFSYLLAAKVVAVNPASTKLVPPPPVPTDPAGRALEPKEVRYLLSGPDRTKPEGARDYALMLVMLRLSLRLSEVCSLRFSSMTTSQGRWVLKCKVKGGREEVWPLPKDVKEAIDDYLSVDSKRRDMQHSDGPDAPLFQPHFNYRTLVFDRSLSPRHVQRIVAKWGRFSGIGKITPHDLRRTVVTELLNRGYSYREVQMVTKHRDPKTVMRYDHARENLDKNPINTFGYEE